MQLIRLFSLFTVLSNGIGLISVTLIAVENKADYAIDYQKTKRVLVVCYRSIYYNFVVIATRGMQLTRLFLSFTVLTSAVGFVFIPQSADCIERFFLPFKS